MIRSSTCQSRQNDRSGPTRRSPSALVSYTTLRDTILAFAMLLSYAWQNDYCFPGQERLAKDMGLSDRSVRTHLKSLEANGLLAIRRRGQGLTNIYELNLKPKRI
jgi:biotin operon repressor